MGERGGAPAPEGEDQLTRLVGIVTNRCSPSTPASSKCNANQCQVLVSLFHRLRAHALRWQIGFAEEFRSPQLQRFLGALVATVEAGDHLISLYEEERWLQTAVFTLENKLGFADAVRDIHKHVVMVLTNVHGATAEKQEILAKLVEVEHLEADADDWILDAAFLRDKRDLRSRAEDPSGGSPALFMRRRFKGSALRTIRSKFDDGLHTIAENDVVTQKELLGQGSYGRVRRGKWLQTLNVAIKESVADDHFLRREFEIMRALPPHPNVVQVLGLIGTPITRFAMELMDMNLSKYLQSYPKPTLLQAVEMILQISKGMAFLHQNDVCYRDLKPQNILLKGNGKYLKLADFGHSKSHFNSLRNDNTGIAGTVMYMAPEVLQQPFGQYDRRSDVFSFAICCSEILTGRDDDFFSSCSIIERLEKIRAGVRPRLCTDVHLRLRQLIEQCWELNSSHRPSFDTILERLLMIKEDILRGAEGMNGLQASSSSSTSGLSSETARGVPEQRVQDLLTNVLTEYHDANDTEHVPNGNPAGSNPTPTEEPHIQGLVIHGNTFVGVKLTARWTSGNACMAQWFRSQPDGDPILIGNEEHLREPSSVYVLTPDDLNFVIGIRCMSVPRGLQRSGEITSCTTDTHVSLDAELREKFESCVRNQFAEFSVKIDRQARRGKLIMAADKYQLWWHLTSRFNFRATYTESIHLGDDPLVCVLQHSGREFTLKFSDERKRNLAVLVWRHFAHQ